MAAEPDDGAEIANCIIQADVDELGVRTVESVSWILQKFGTNFLQDMFKKYCLNVKR